MKTRILNILTAALLLGSVRGRADAVGDWNAIMIATVTVDPFNQARFAAITQLAVFEAVNAIAGDFHPYLGINHRDCGRISRSPLASIRLRLPAGHLAV